jgi:hypothetical protein
VTAARATVTYVGRERPVPPARPEVISWRREDDRRPGPVTAPDSGLDERYEAARALALRAGALAAEYADRLSSLDVR